MTKAWYSALDALGQMDDRRIAAAIHACHGIPTEALETGVVGELITALKVIAEWQPTLPDNHDATNLIIIAKAALVKAGSP